MSLTNDSDLYEEFRVVGFGPVKLEKEPVLRTRTLQQVIDAGGKVKLLKKEINVDEGGDTVACHWYALVSL